MQSDIHFLGTTLHRHGELEAEYWKTLENGGPRERLKIAEKLLATVAPEATNRWRSALCVLLEHGKVNEVRSLLEQILFKDFDQSYKLLLPLLAHVYQRLYDFETAHLLFSVCDRQNLLTGVNQWAKFEHSQVAFGLAEHLQFSELGTKSFQAIGVRSRALCELALANAYPGNQNQERPEHRLPDFMIIGSAKCGTSFLYDLICRSADVWNRTPKEIHYFTNLYNFGTAFYSRFFSACPDGQICGEASPDYLDICNPILDNYVDVAQRANSVAPASRIIVVLRDPAIRAISLYNQIVTNRAGSGPRAGKLKLDELSFDELANYYGGYALKSGHYVAPLRRYVELFGKDQILILRFPERNAKSELIRQLSSFLEIRPPDARSLKDLVTNRGSHSAPATRLYGELREYYAQSLKELDHDFGIVL